MSAIVSASQSSWVVLQYSTIHRGTQRQQPFYDYVCYPRVTPSPISLTRRTNHIPAAASNPNSNNKKIKKKPNKRVPQKDDKKEKILDDNDPIEALFSLLEEDLKNDFLSEDFDDELTEEDLAKLEQELEEALGNDAELSGMGSSNSENSGTDNDVGDDDDDDDDDDEEEDEEDEDEDEEERPLELRKWQLRRLASALKIGRRKTSIKSLAAELCLDRAVVLELLRNPPPDLLLLSAALPDRVVPTTPETDTKLIDPSTEVTEDVSEPAPEPELEGKLPVHVMQSRWMMQKRLKKVQVETLQRVYNRTKRPTNTMISSIVHVTNLPRKRVVQWFEDKRAEDGVPQKRLPFGRSTSETILTN